MAKKINVDIKMIKPLVAATNEYIMILRDLPETEQYLFRVEYVPVLDDEWDNFFGVINLLVSAHADRIEINEKAAARIAWYLDAVSKFFHAINDKRDWAYIDAVNMFFKKFRKELPRVAEDLFWAAEFPVEKYKKIWEQKKAIRDQEERLQKKDTPVVPMFPVDKKDV